MNYIVQGVILVYFVGMFALGILGEQRTKNTADYYVAGRQVNGFFSGFVYMTSLVSAGALVGWVSQTWQWGVYFIYAGSAVTVATFLCWWLLGRKLCHSSRDLDLFTIPDFLEKRFESRTARLISSVLLIIFSIPLLVTQFTAIGILFNVTTGLSYKAAVICFGIIVFLYVSFGGYYAVVYTDVAQGILMLVGIITLLVASVRRVGPAPQLQYAEIFPQGFVSWPGEGSAITPMFFIAFILLTFFGALGAPNYIRGFYSMRNNQAFRQGFTITISIVVVLEVGIVLLGLFGRVIFPELDTADNIVYYMIQSLLPPFLAGLALAGLSAAVMSTVDSLLIQCASTVENDILTKTFHLNLSEHRRVSIARVTVALIGAICVFWGLNPPEYLAFLMYPAWGALGLSFAWVFFLGLYWQRFNKAGAITAMLTSSVTFVAWSALGNPWGIYHIQMALLVSIPSTLLATWLTAPTSEKTLSLFFRANSPISIQRGQRIRKDMLSGE